MDSKNSFDEKTMIDNNLSNRYIDLDPNGYFIIKVDLEENKIILEHFLNNINDDGYALDPETNEPIKCDSQNKSCLLYTSPSPRDSDQSRMPSSA